PATRPGDVDLKRSKVYVHTFITRFGHEHGIGGRLAGGNLQLGEATAAGKFVFDMAGQPEARKFLKIAGDESESAREKINETMHGQSVLDIRRFPQATFDVASA